MTRSDSGADVSMEVFVKQNVITPIRIVLKFIVSSEYRPLAILIAQENFREPLRQLCRNFPQVHHVAGSSGAFDFEVRSQVVMELLERFNDQIVDREPDRTSPVRISAEQPVLDSAGS